MMMKGYVKSKFPLPSSLPEIPFSKETIFIRFFCIVPEVF